MFRIDVLAGPPGCGKSEKMISDAAAEPGRYLFALPTIDLVGEQVRRFRHAAPQAQAVPIHSGSGARSNVGRRVEELLTRFDPESHVAAFITHEALMDGDFSGFQGWHARIDEPPNAITTSTVRLAQSVATFRDHFDLVPFEAGWSQLRPRLDASWKSIAEDTMWHGLTDFRKLAQRPQGVLMQIENWSEAQKGEVPWMSLWTPLQLRSMSSITMAGAGFLKSIGYRVMHATYGREMRFEVTHLGSARTAQPRIYINYFTRAHRGSTIFWSTSEGRACLVQIEQWLSENVPALGFWSGNEAVRHSFEHRSPGRMTAPKVAGLNCYREAQSCAFFYSSKALPQDKTLETVFGITADEILRAREDEDIFQFVMRGAVRDPRYGGDYDVYLYSVDQAERLRETLAQNGFADVEVIGIEEARLMEVSRPGAARCAPILTVDAEARLAEKRAGAARRSRKARAKKKEIAMAEQPRSGGEPWE